MASMPLSSADLAVDKNIWRRPSCGIIVTMAEMAAAISGNAVYADVMYGDRQRKARNDLGRPSSG